MGSYFKKQGSSYSFIVNEKPFIALAGEVHNSASSCIAHMEPIWDRLSELGLNTVVLPIYWELIEEKPNEFNFSLLDEWIMQAENHNLKLIFLWFGTWKNAQSTYVPEWIKCDLQKYPRAILSNGTISRAISCFCEECRNADANAFAAVMGHLRDYDKKTTVIAVQAENESGLLGSMRDHSKAANEKYSSDVPQSVLSLLDSYSNAFTTKALKYSQNGTDWESRFGSSAPEAFMAYYTALYIDYVVQKGKEAYSDIPVFVNAWTAQCPNEPAGSHPSGGPTAKFHSIWKSAAPHIDAFAPDLYLETFEADFSEYSSLPENPFLIPETRNDKWAAALSFYAIGEFNALCFSPFAVEDIGTDKKTAAGTNIQSVFQTMNNDVGCFDMLKSSYGLLGELTPLITSNLGTKNMRGFIQNKLFNQAIEFDNFILRIHFDSFIDQVDYPAGGLIIKLSDNQAPDGNVEEYIDEYIGEFILAGFGYSVTFCSKSDSCPNSDFVSIDEGHYINGEWVRSRRLNGDELFAKLPASPSMLRVRVHRF